MSGTNPDGGIDVQLLEKRLEGLRDTQESVQGLSIWCQANKKFSTSIIDTWLKCLKKSPVEKRLTLFYLANDVVQHARRKGDSTLINQWAVAVQKATPHVRTPSSISSAIARIFKIWEERNIYSRDAVADLLSLLNSSSGKEKNDKQPSNKKPETYTASAEKVSTFQPSTMISKVKLAFRLKSHLGVTFRTKHYVNMNMEQLIGSIKDNQHGMEVIQEITQLVEECRTSEHKLLNEVDERRKIVEIAEIGIVSYENIRGEAGIVNTAYKNFTHRVECTKAKVDEKIKAFQEMESPEPSFPGPDFFNTTGDKNFDKISTVHTNYIPIEVIQGTNLETLKSINLPPQHKPIETVPQSQYTITDYSIGNASCEPAEVSYQPSTGYSSSIQSVSPGYDMSVSPWTNESYSSMITSMVNLQYQQPQQQVAPSTPSPVFTLTPSMQLQMQMQQQHVAALQQQQYHAPPPHSYSNDNSYHTSQPQPAKVVSGAGDIGLIPLPLSDPPLPPEPNHNTTTADAMYDSYRPPLPNEFTAITNQVDQEYQLDTSFDSGGKSPVSYSHPSRYHPYNNSQDELESYARANSGDSNTNIRLIPGLASTPMHSQFGSTGPPRFRQRTPNSSSNNGYRGNDRFTSPQRHSILSPVKESPRGGGTQGNRGGFFQQRETTPIITSTPDHNFGNFDFGSSEGDTSSNMNGSDSSAVEDNSYNQNQLFFERNFTNSPVRMPNVQKGGRMLMSQPNLGIGRGSGGRMSNMYDARGFRRAGRGMGMRGGFDRGGRRGGYR